MRVSAVIRTEKGFVLFHRLKNRKEYYCLPGGHAEKNEDEKKAMIRECFEELGVNVKIGKKILAIWRNFNNEKEVFYECFILSGVLGNGKGDEFKDKRNGIYKIEIVKNLNKINLLPEEIKLILGK